MSQTKSKKTTELKGWKAIAAYLVIPPATAQRWAREGMPVRREGRFTVAGCTTCRSLKVDSMSFSNS